MEVLRSPEGKWPLRVALLLAVCVGLVTAGTAGASSKAVAPANTAAPVVTGTAQAGSTLSASSGTWTGDLPITFAYQWQRCDSAGANCVDIASATGPTFALTAADVGHQIRVGVTATNAGGVDVAYSLTTATVTAAGVAPANTALPTVTGSPVVGQTLTASSGTWTGDPTITFTYQWQRCDNAGANCVAIPSATAATYIVAAADVGHELRVSVTGTNGTGNATAASAPTAVVTAAAAGAPAAVFPPIVTGMPYVGMVLSGSTGSWTGTLPLSFAFEWQRCDQTGQGCQAIAGATGQSYTVVTDDVGHRIRLHVTATNSVASTDAFSRTTGVAQAAPTGQQGKQLCKRGGWRFFGFGFFRNQGQCVRVFEHGGRIFGGRGDDEGGERGNGGSGKIGINPGLRIGGASGTTGANTTLGSNGRGNGRGHDD